MATALMTATATGTATYLWLTVSAVPISRALRATLRSRWEHGWRYALPLAAGVSALTGAIACAFAILIAMWAPRAGALLGDATLLTAGISAGLLVWCARAGALGVPRLSPDAEVALALAVVALKSDDAALLAMVEREYARHVIWSGEQYVPRVASTVLGV